MPQNNSAASSVGDPSCQRNTSRKSTCCVYFKDSLEIYFIWWMKIFITKQVLSSSIMPKKLSLANDANISQSLSTLSKNMPYARIRSAAIVRTRGGMPYLFSKHFFAIGIFLSPRGRSAIEWIQIKACEIFS